MGIELINDQSERDRLAELNLIAGKKAKAAAAYKPAFNYLRVGVGLLSDWQRLYELTLDLYVEAAEAAYSIADFDEMERLANPALQRAKTLLDKVKLYELKIQACIAQNQMLEAVKIGLAVVKMLGVNLPEKPNKLNILLGFVRTKLTLAGKRIEDVYNLPQMTDPYKLAAIRIIYIVGSAAYSAVPELFALMVFKQVNLSVKHGNANESTCAYGANGIILCGRVGNINSGYQFGKLALRLLDRFNAKHLKARTIQAINLHVRHWKEHLRETLEPLLEGYQSGLETGDLQSAATCAAAHSCHSYLLGKELAELERGMAIYSETIAQLGQETALNYNELNRQVVLNLMGQSENPCRLSGESYEEEKMLLHQQANDRTAIYSLYLSKLVLCYLFSEYSQAIENAAIAENYLDGATGLAIVPLFHFYDSLAQLSVFPDAQKSEQKRILKKVTANQKKMKKWAHHAPMNYLHKFYLVEAERHRVVCQETKAMDLYEQAIELAKEYEYINEEALANELAAKFYLGSKTTIASAYMLNARYCYLRWGATRKVKDLDTRYPQLLSRMSEKIRKETLQTEHSLSESSSEILDLTTVVKASQAISSEILLDKLLAKLMKIVMENAGAQKGYLILSKYQKLFIEVAGIVEPSTEIVRQSIPVANNQDLPITLINYVERTLETVVLDSAIQSELFMHDPYINIQKPKSILCTPILNQGKLISIIYLENNLTSGAFTSQRLEILRLLCSQAAVSLENAQLYEQLENYSHTLEQTVVERTRELQANNQQLQQEICDRQKAEAALHSANQQLTNLASLDGLTQIANRRRFNEYLSQQWQLGARESTSLSLILCDVDYFKRYNDTYGHQAGDTCLQQVVGAISRVIKRPADLVARYGGEEFAIVLPHTEASGALHLAEAMQKEVQQLRIPHEKSSVSEYLSVSVGVSSTVPQQKFSPEALIAVADRALYQAKEQGRNRVVVENLYL